MHFYNKIIFFIQKFLKNFFFIVYNLLSFIDKFFYLVFRKKFFYWIKEFFEKDCYKNINILGKNTIFFTPNEITDWRVKTFFKKEPETLEWIDTFTGNKIIFWDIGSNIGLYSIYAALKHKNIEVISFEPSINNLRILSRNIFKNNLTEKIKIFQMPVSEKENYFSEMREAEFIEGWSMSTFGENKNFEGLNFKSNHNYKIFGTNINFLLEKKILNIPDHVKIDVDGIEHKILLGANTLLESENLKSLSIELNENYVEQFNTVHELMKKKGFVVKHKKQGNLKKRNEFSNTFNFIFEKI